MNNPSLLLQKAIKLNEQMLLLKNSVTFTYNAINNLTEDASIEELSTLMARLKIDYNELLKQEKEYESVRIEVNTLYKKEIIPALSPTEPIDFTL